MYINKLFLILFFSFLQHYCGAQKKAVTELGDEVILYDNGTWKYSKEFDVNDSSEIKISPIVYTKSKNASFLLKSSHGNLGYWVDPKKWTFGKSSSNPNSDFELEFKGQSLFSVIISEEAAIPVESYIKIAVQNGRESCPDIHITHKEYRIVNGIKVLNLQMEGTLAGVKFAYFGYYFSNENTAVQFIVTSYAATFKKYQSEAEELLNGLTVLPTTTDDTQKKASLQDIKSDSLKQGLYSPNNKCKQFFEGNWSYLMNGKVVTVKRTFKK
ncbi:MAG: hypothetical protein ABIP30_16995, partial [Ferruginibacter sp.]